MASGLKLVHRRLVWEFNQRREEKNHVATLIHDRCVAEGAADFAGKLVCNRFGGRVIPFEMVVAFGEVDVGFVENRGPLKRCGYGEKLAYRLYRKTFRLNSTSIKGN